MTWDVVKNWTFYIHNSNYVPIIQMIKKPWQYRHHRAFKSITYFPDLESLAKLFVNLWANWAYSKTGIVRLLLPGLSWQQFRQTLSLWLPEALGVVLIHPIAIESIRYCFCFAGLMNVWKWKIIIIKKQTYHSNTFLKAGPMSDICLLGDSCSIYNADRKECGRREVCCRRHRRSWFADSTWMFLFLFFMDGQKSSSLDKLSHLFEFVVSTIDMF